MRPRSYTYEGMTDYDARDRDEAAYEREQEDKFERRREDQFRDDETNEEKLFRSLEEDES